MNRNHQYLDQFRPMMVRTMSGLGVGILLAACASTTVPIASPQGSAGPAGGKTALRAGASAGGGGGADGAGGAGSAAAATEFNATAGSDGAPADGFDIRRADRRGGRSGGPGGDAMSAEDPNGMVAGGGNGASRSNVGTGGAGGNGTNAGDAGSKSNKQGGANAGTANSANGAGGSTRAGGGGGGNAGGAGGGTGSSAAGGGTGSSAAGGGNGSPAAGGGNGTSAAGGGTGSPTAGGGNGSPAAGGVTGRDGDMAGGPGATGGRSAGGAGGDGSVGSNGTGGAGAAGTAAGGQGGGDNDPARVAMARTDGGRSGVDAIAAAPAERRGRVDTGHNGVQIDRDEKSVTLDGFLPTTLGMGEGQFEFDRFTLSDDVKAKLDLISEKLETAPYDRLYITGYSDRIGDSDYNKTLSEKRAWAVAGYLMDKGIPPEKVKVEGRGETNSLVAGGECMVLRRAELIQCLERDRRVELQATVKEYNLKVK